MAEHSPNTSEYSAPHESTACPETHVDQLHFGDNGQHESQYDVHHITDDGAVSMGRETYDQHQSNKSSSDDDSSGNSGK
jgi:hypothetical protein